MDWFSSWEKSCKVGIAMFVGAAMMEAGGKNKNFETIFTEEREGGYDGGRLTCVPEKTRKILRVSNRISIRISSLLEIY